MFLSKCKKSVFCAYFFVFFFLGTISGIFCYQLLISSNASLLQQYSGTISSALFEDKCSAVFSAVRPFLVIAVLALFEHGYRVIFPYLFIRAFLSAYTAAALWIGGCDLCVIFLRCMFLVLPLYGICYWCYFRES